MLSVSYLFILYLLTSRCNALSQLYFTLEDDVCNEFASLFLSFMSVDFASKLAISRADGIEPLVNLLSSPDPDVQKNVLQTLYHLVEVSSICL